MPGLGLVFGYDAYSGARLAGPVANAWRPRSRGILGAIKSYRRQSGVCGDGCWPAPNGGCDCGAMVRGIGAPVISPSAVTTLAVLATLAVGATIYGKLHSRGR